MKSICKCGNEVAVLVRRGWPTMKKNQFWVPRLTGLSVGDIQSVDLRRSKRHICWDYFWRVIHSARVSFPEADLAVLSHSIFGLGESDDVYSDYFYPYFRKCLSPLIGMELRHFNYSRAVTEESEPHSCCSMPSRLSVGCQWTSARF